MPKRSSRVLKFEERPSADLLVPDIIHALNGTYRLPYDRDRLIDLVRELQELEKIWAETDARFQREKSGHMTTSEAVQKPWRLICAILHQYTAHPTLSIAWEHPDGDQQPDAAWRLEWNRSGGKPHFDLEFALNAMDIFKAGRISSLKQCDQCGKWFLGRFSHQRFCSDECKELFHRFNEADKERRRKWAKQNYQSRKELELGSRKSAAQRRGGKR